MSERVPSDRELVANILAGDPGSSAVLFRRHVGALYRFVAYRTHRNHHDAEDLTQETFAEALRALPSYDPNRCFYRWLCGIARRRLSRFYRARGSGPPTVDAAALIDAIESDGPLPPDALERTETRALVAGCLAELAPRHRELLEQKYREGLSLAEIGERRSSSSEAVSSALQRARAALVAAIRRQAAELVPDRR